MKSDAATYTKTSDRASHSKAGDLFTLAKVRLNTLVVITTAAGYFMTRPESVDPLALILTCLGTALVAGGAAAINQIDERDIDRLMNRTRERPLAEGRMSVTQGWLIALGLSVSGLAALWVGANPLATRVALATLAVYVFIYTPLKRKTSLSTVIGAIPGALPPLIGWTAAGRSLSTVEPWILFFIMFLWQLPHFLAISWMFREDYGRAGLPMLSVVDKHGGVVGRQALLWAATLIPISQLPFLFGFANAAYAVGALILGLAQLALAFSFARHRSLANARILFLGSIVYLPLLWALMVWGRPAFPMS